jgi:hypothetical protein
MEEEAVSLVMAGEKNSSDNGRREAGRLVRATIRGLCGYR